MSSVWVMLHIDGEKNSKGQPVEIETLPHNINALKKLAKEKLKPKIDYAPLSDIYVYAASVKLNNLENATPLRAGIDVPTDTTDEEPLIVTAPPPPQQQQQQLSKAQHLYQEEVVKAWTDNRKDSETLEKLRTLPTHPFPVTTDDRPRYELDKKFVKRACFDTFETTVKEAAKAAIGWGRAAAISVLGAKGAGKSVFFRYLLYKHCTERLVVYVPNAVSTALIYEQLMNGVLFGLQCCNHSHANAMLRVVRSSPKSGNLADFYHSWTDWGKQFSDLCGDAYIFIDQLQRTGDLFSALEAAIIDHCAAYVLISSTGILHRHNVSSVYKKLTYHYPVHPRELAAIDEGNKLGHIREMTTMLGAISIMEGQDIQDLCINAARKHYDRVKGKSLLGELLATVQSEERQEAMNGSIWEEVLDLNYFYVDENKMVKAMHKEYMVEMRKLLKSDKVKRQRLF